MKFTPFVCVVLFGLVLVPTDGRLKYGGHTDLGEADRGQSNVTREEEDEEEQEPQGHGEMASDQTRTTAASANCHHSPAHYGWTLHRLSQQLAAAAAAATAAAAVATGSSTRTTTDLNDDNHGDDDVEKRGDGQWGPVKRTSADYGRELSADLYAQYPSSCACQTKYELLDLGYTHFPRYIVNAICQNRSASSRKCWRGSSCKEIPYKVRVLTRRSDGGGEHGTDTDHHSTLLPEPLRAYWRFKTVTIAAACQCSL
ncbi:uncharacterized protein LOC125958749 [Anopheles darlingi]|uniref:uncharacterized protein LOC125958749 n=1 Tax=Anopheles darlingi TaxID=43151 RepID=UPI0021000B55|nr:uncharacterized protein LOC125958749 [Anopheles darlingi]